MKSLILSVLFIIPVFLFAQDYKMSGEINGLDEQTITISNFYGNEDKVIDSVKTDYMGFFVYTFPKNSNAGMYRLRFGQNQFMDIIFNNENISFSTDSRALIDSLNFSKSIENQLYFEYLNQRNLTEYKSELLGPVITYYPQDDPFYADVEHKFDEITGNFEDFVFDLVNDNPKTYVAKLVEMDYTPPPPSALSQEAKMQFMKMHFFDNIDFSDTTMLYSNIFSGKVIQYLSFYQNNRMNKDQLQVEFIKAVNVIMDATSVNTLVYEYVMDYLIGGFESYGFEKVISYIADNINLDESCVNSERKAELEKKVESLKKFAVGKKAPDFTTTDLKGNSLTLSQMKTDYTILIFWATWCPHCTRLISELQQIYLPDNRDKFEIISVSLDDSKEDLDRFLGEGNYNWIHVSDFKKWGGEVVQKYDVYATPTIFVIYKDLTILAKPTTYNELKDVLYERNILH